MFHGHRLRTLGLALLIGGCAARPPRAVSDPDPAVKIPRIKQAVAENDLTHTRQLIKDLESDDPAVRFYAIQALERLTGQTHGYIYYTDESTREPAIVTWKQWLDNVSTRPNGAGKRRE